MGTMGRARAQPSSITATIHRESRERKRTLWSDGASEDAATSGAPTVGGAFFFRRSASEAAFFSRFLADKRVTGTRCGENIFTCLFTGPRASSKSPIAQV